MLICSPVKAGPSTRGPLPVETICKEGVTGMPTILEDSLSVKLNSRICWRCKHGLSFHTHPGKLFWSQGSLRQNLGAVVTRCGKEGCSCTGFRTEPLTMWEMEEMTRRIKGGWRGKT